MMVGGAEIGLEHTFELGGDGTAHQHKRIDWKEGILTEFRCVMAANEALGLQRVVFRLVLDAAKRIERRHVARRLVDAAEQDRDIFEFRPGAPFNPRKDQFRQVSVRASEIEQEFYFQGHVDSSRRARCWSGSMVSRLNPSLLSILTVLKTNCQTLRNFPVLTRTLGDCLEFST